MQTFGIDVSTFQKGFNFSKAKAEGVEFVIIRGGYTGSKNKALAKDDQFENHYKNAKANGLSVGAYWFSRACSYDEGVKEAIYFYNNCLKGKQFEYPVCIDVEDNVYQAKAGKENVTQAIIGFCETLENFGCYASIYANVYWFKNYINLGKLKDYDKWIASWGTTKPTIKGGLWQFGGETNKIRTNKIAGVTCDQNYSYKDYPSIIKNTHLNGFIELKQEDNINVPQEPQTDGTTYYTVQKGDYLIKIGKKFNVNWKTIAQYNNIKAPFYIIKVGQKLVIKR